MDRGGNSCDQSYVVGYLAVRDGRANLLWHKQRPICGRERNALNWNRQALSLWWDINGLAAGLTDPTASGTNEVYVSNHQHAYARRTLDTWRMGKGLPLVWKLLKRDKSPDTQWGQSAGHIDNIFGYWTTGLIMLNRGHRTDCVREPCMLHTLRGPMDPLSQSKWEAYTAAPWLRDRAGYLPTSPSVVSNTDTCKCPRVRERLIRT